MAITDLYRAIRKASSLEEIYENEKKVRETYKKELLNSPTFKAIVSKLYFVAKENPDFFKGVDKVGGVGELSEEEMKVIILLRTLDISLYFYKMLKGGLGNG
jgi:hypothetical protein